mmetsp:Transcript_77837/g.238158  ORF Transcript_77837/g.238158 Transcript_77837/m.238158 type:complete len:293 (+) Transcript_77837:569-1447(+)
MLPQPNLGEVAHGLAIDHGLENGDRRQFLQGGGAAAVNTQETERARALEGDCEVQCRAFGFPKRLRDLQRHCRVHHAKQRQDRVGRALAAGLHAPEDQPLDHGAYHDAQADDAPGLGGLDAQLLALEAVPHASRPHDRARERREDAAQHLGPRQRRQTPRVCENHRPSKELCNWAELVEGGPSQRIRQAASNLVDSDAEDARQGIAIGHYSRGLGEIPAASVADKYRLRLEVQRVGDDREEPTQAHATEKFCLHLGRRAGLTTLISRRRPTAAIVANGRHRHQAPTSANKRH